VKLAIVNIVSNVLFISKSFCSNKYRAFTYTNANATSIDPNLEDERLKISNPSKNNGLRKVYCEK
jgi:hypothetical protein